MSSNWRAVIGVLLVFGFGFASGWLGSSVYHDRQAIDVLRSSPEGIAAIWENRMTHNLSLDENQKRQIHQYFLENLAQRKELQKQIAPQVVVLNHSTLRQIISVLSPDQVVLFRKNIAFLRQHFSQGPFNPNPDGQLVPRRTGQMPGTPTNGLESPPAPSSTSVFTNTTSSAPVSPPAPAQ
jgi:hypothetical protein